MQVYKAVIGGEKNESDKEVLFDSIPTFLMEAKKLLSKFPKADVKTNSLDRLQYTEAHLNVPEVIMALNDLKIYYLEVRVNRKIKMWINFTEEQVVSAEEEDDEED